MSTMSPENLASHAKECAQECLERFDKNNDGKIDRAEAELMLKETYDGMRSDGNDLGFAEWNDETFDQLFKGVDKDGSGFLETSEIETFVHELFTKFHII